MINKMRPHLRVCAPGIWMCTISREEKHTSRAAVAAGSPKAAYEIWIKLIEIVDPVQLGIHTQNISAKIACK